MDRRRLQRLLVLDHGVLELVAVVFRQLQLPRRVGARQRNRIRLERGREIDERLLDRQQAQEHFVRNGLVQFLLQVVRALVDVVEVAQKEDAAVPQKAEGETVAVGGRAHAADLVQERGRHRRVRAADRYDGLSEQDDAEWDRAVGDDGVVLRRARHVHDQHGGFVVIIETRPFVGVERVRQEVARHFGKRQHAFEFRRRGFDQVDPAGGRKLKGFLEAAVLPPVNRHHGASPRGGRVLRRTATGSGCRSRRASGCPGCRT